MQNKTVLLNRVYLLKAISYCLFHSYTLHNLKKQQQDKFNRLCEVEDFLNKRIYIKKNSLPKNYKQMINKLSADISQIRYMEVYPYIKGVKDINIAIN